MNKEHVKFALEQWAKAHGYKAVGFYDRDPNDVYGGVIGVRWSEPGTNREGYHRPVIDHDFLRELPINDEVQYYMELITILFDGVVALECIKSKSLPVPFPALIFKELTAIHNATVDQRLGAYYEAFK